MNLPPRAFEIVNIIYNMNVQLATSGDDQARRDVTRMMAQQIAYELGPQWGCKARDSRAPQSADTIAYKLNDTTMDLWDWQNGTTLAPQLLPNQTPTYPNYTGAFFIQVDPINHLNVGAPPNPNPNPTTTPNPSPNYDAIITELANTISKLGNIILENNARMDSLASTVATQTVAMQSIANILQALVDKKITIESFPNYVATAFGAKIVLKPA